MPWPTEGSVEDILAAEIPAAEGILAEAAILAADIRVVAEAVGPLVELFWGGAAGTADVNRAGRDIRSTKQNRRVRPRSLANRVATR
jgi:hypothetical protein